MSRAFPDAPPPRDLSPEEQRRAGRLVWLVLLAFVALVGGLTAFLSAKGRAVRDYGQSVLSALDTAPAGAWPGYCARVLPGRAIPSTVSRCEVKREAGGPVVELSLENGHLYRVTPKP